MDNFAKLFLTQQRLSWGPKLNRTIDLSLKCMPFLMPDNIFPALLAKALHCMLLVSLCPTSNFCKKNKECTHDDLKNCAFTNFCISKPSTVNIRLWVHCLGSCRLFLQPRSVSRYGPSVIRLEEVSMKYKCSELATLGLHWVLGGRLLWQYFYSQKWITWLWRQPKYTGYPRKKTPKSVRKGRGHQTVTMFSVTSWYKWPPQTRDHFQTSR